MSICLFDLPIVAHPAIRLINLLILESNLLKPGQSTPNQKLLNTPPLTRLRGRFQTLWIRLKCRFHRFPEIPISASQKGLPLRRLLTSLWLSCSFTEELRHRDHSAPAPKLAKAKEPDTFDGSNPKKLNNFILLCNLYFRTNPSYKDDTPK